MWIVLYNHVRRQLQDDYEFLLFHHVQYTERGLYLYMRNVHVTLRYLQ